MVTTSPLITQAELDALCASLTSLQEAFQTEETARIAAETALAHMASVQAITAAFSEAVTTEQVADVIVTHGLEAMGATVGRIYRLSEDGSTFVLLRTRGIPADVIPHCAAIPTDYPAPIVDAVRLQQIMVIERLQELRARYPQFIRHRPDLETGALIAIPLIIHGCAIGAISLSFGTDLTISPEERTFLKTIAQHCAQALERARLYEAAQSEIEARKRAEETLRDRENWYRTLTEFGSDITTVIRAEGTILYESLSVRRILGWSPDELIGACAFQYIHPEDVPLVQAAITATLQGPGPSPLVEFRFRCRDGSWRWLEAIGNNVSGQPGFAGLLIHTRDISDRKAAEETLRQLSHAVEQSPASIVITDRHGDIQYVNPKFTQVTGYTREEVVGQNPRLLRSGETPPHVYADMWQTITQGGEWRGEFHNRRKNGELFWEYASISGVRDGRGEVYCYIAVKEDITERKNAESAVTELSARLQALLDASPVPIVQFDIHGHVALWNPAAARTFGWTASEVLGRYNPLVSNSRSVEFERNLQSVLQGQPLIDLEARRERSDGSSIDVKISAAPVYDAHGEVCGAIEIVADVTQNKRAEKQIQRQVEQLQALRTIDGPNRE